MEKNAKNKVPIAGLIGLVLLFGGYFSILGVTTMYGIAQTEANQQKQSQAETIDVGTFVDCGKQPTFFLSRNLWKVKTTKGVFTVRTFGQSAISSAVDTSCRVKGKYLWIGTRKYRIEVQ